MGRVFGLLMLGLCAGATASPLWAGATSDEAALKTAQAAYLAGDYPKALQIYRPMAIAGNALAQYDLGIAYKRGRGVTQDLNQALDWFKRAADHNPPLAEAQDELGLLLFQTGKRQEALPYLQQSAGRGDPRAQYVLGTAYFNGDLVQKDNVRAYALMTRASASGNLPKASEALATMDNYIPLEQRQRGLALAREMELATQNQQLATLDPRGTGAVPTGPAPIRTVEVPASTTPGVTYASPPPAPVMASPKPRPVRVVKPVKPAEIAPAVHNAPPEEVTAPVTHPARVAPSGHWRVQLGAFGDQAKAQRYGEGLLAKAAALGDLKFFLVNAGAVTRLQAGPLASKAEAEHLCASVKAHGAACIPVNP